MRLFFLPLALLLLTLPSWAQERVRNIRLRAVDSSRLEIRYDLITARPGDSIYFDVRSRLRGTLRVLPEFVRGDIGTRITPGSDRRIIWDALANGYSLNEEIQAIVRVKTNPLLASTQPDVTNPKPDVVPTRPTPTAPVAVAQPQRTEQPLTDTPKPVTQPSNPVSTSVTQPRTAEVPFRADTAQPYKRRYAGPAWALLSAVAPGVGNIFVQWPKPKIGLRPLVTLTAYGLVAYGLMERQKSRDDFAIYEQQKNKTEAEPYYATANDHYHKYYMATRGAIVIAAVDVVLTFIKGLHNNRLEKEARRIRSFNLQPGFQAGQPTAVVRYSF